MPDGLGQTGTLGGIAGGGGSVDLLGGPPPTPRLAIDQDRQPTSLADLAPPQPVSADALPAPVLQGIVQAATEMSTAIDGFAQATPDLSQDWLMVKLALQRVLGRLAQAGASSLGPTTAGTEFPGGGMQRTEPGL